MRKPYWRCIQISLLILFLLNILVRYATQKKHGKSAAEKTCIDGHFNTGITNVPLLFDKSQWPSRRQSCSHCPNITSPCCGVCMFDWPCDRLHPNISINEWQSDMQRYLTAQPESFSPCNLLTQFQGRTLWFIGDSQMNRFYQAVECYLRDYAPSLQRSGIGNDDIALDTLAMLPATAVPICLSLVANTRICMIRSNYGSEIYHIMRTLFMRQTNFKQDMIIFNFGLHYNIRATQQYVDDVLSIVKWRSILASYTQQPVMVWMETPPQHFSSSTGEYGEHNRSSTCRPANTTNPIVVSGGHWNEMAAMYYPVLADTVLKIYNASLPAYNLHAEGASNDCTHWCSPSVYHLWVTQLFTTLSELNI